MSAPTPLTPPEGYRLVTQEEIPTVPEGALHCYNDSDGWSDWTSTKNQGREPSFFGYYAIPIVKEDAKEVEALKAEIEAMRQHIGNQEDDLAAARNELAALKTTHNRQSKINDALFQLVAVLLQPTKE